MWKGRLGTFIKPNPPRGWQWPNGQVSRVPCPVFGVLYPMSFIQDSGMRMPHTWRARWKLSFRISYLSRHMGRALFPLRT